MSRFIIVILAGLFFHVSCSSEKKEKLTIATAANMQFPMEEIIREFTAKTGIKCIIIPGSSGKLSAMILENAPYDIFVSADSIYPNKLFRKGIGIEAPSVYAFGKLVLWTCDESINPEINILSSVKIRHIAMANPETAPYGKAAMELLRFYKLDASLAHKFVFGESIAQTNQFILTQSAEIGFTAMSTVLSKKLKSKGNWIEPNPDSYTPIAQAFLLLNNKETVKKFRDFLSSGEARKILKKYGYLTPDESF